MTIGTHTAHYTLCSIVAKSGGLEDGHYITVARQPFAPPAATQWWRIDDDKATRVLQAGKAHLSDAPLFRSYCPTHMLLELRKACTHTHT